jgi:hypothetical protein
MADGTTPAAPAVNGTPAPNGAGGTISEAKPVAPKTGWDFAKDGPLKFKAFGKERSIDSLDKLQQRLSYSEAYEERAKTLEQQMREVQPKLQKLDGLKKAPPKDFWKGLSEEFGEDAVAKAAEEYFLDRIAREEKDNALSPDAKRMKADLERLQTEKGKLEADAKKREEEAETAKHEAATREYYNYLNDVIGEGLQSIPGIKAEAAPYFMPTVAAALHRAVELGIEPTPQLVAQEVFNTQQAIATGLLQHLEPSAVVDLLESIITKGTDGKPGKSLRYAVMQEWVDRRNRKSPDGETPPQESVTETEEPRAARRTTGKDTKKSWAEVRRMLKMTPPLRTK